MNKYGCNHCPPPRRRKKRKSECRKIGIAMVLLGILTVFALFLPANYWVIILSIAFVVFGVILIKK